jgi:hypothetical protein
VPRTDRYDQSFPGGALPGVTPLTDQITAELAVPWIVAINC